MTAHRRNLLARALAVLAALALVLAVAASYVRSTVVDSDQFADRATVALHSPSIRSLITDTVTDDLVLHKAPNLVAAKPLIEGVVSSVVASNAFAALFRAGVRDLHRAVLHHDRNTVTLTVADVGTLAAAALEAVKPKLAGQVRSTRLVRLVRDNVGTIPAKAIRIADDVRLLAVLLAIVAVLAAGGAVAVARDRRHACVELGIAVAVAGVLLIVVLAIGEQIARAQVSGGAARSAVGAVYNAFLDDLRTEAWIIAGIGAVFAAASSSLIRPVSIDEPLARAWRALVTEPRRPWVRALRGIALVAAGVFVVAEHQMTITIVLTALGVYLIYGGAYVLLSLINRPEGQPAPAADPQARRSRTRALVGACTVVAVALVAALGGFFGSGGVTQAAPEPQGCNGSTALCDRALPQIALAATHNSMSVPLPGWFSAEQEDPIADQLDGGIRGLLFDTHYAVRVNKTHLLTQLNGELDKMLKQDPLPEDAIKAAMRLRDRFEKGKVMGKPKVYLCHMFCELGGTPLISVLRDIRDFLVAHPNQVLVVVNEDYVSPKDFVSVVKASGLTKFVYRGPTQAGRWPTLRQMIDSNQRIVFLAENEAGAAAWYHPAYEGITEETPYEFKHVSQLTKPPKLAASCEPNRGPKRGAPLFLVNGWISTNPAPLPSNAAKVNAYGPLLRRLRTCERLRHHIPNLVAVDFYKQGDVFKAVDALNGISGPTP
jgi:hypothetical protein